MVARYLQQDTMGIRGNISVSNELRIYVMDSLPRFIEYVPEVDLGTTTAETFKVKRSLYEIVDPVTGFPVPDNEYTTRDYDWSRFIAGTTVTDLPTEQGNRNLRPKFLVNVTDQLRFQMDINTDDELEDLAAEETLVP